MRCPGSSKQDREPGIRLGYDGEPPQFGVSRGCEPDEQRMTGARAQDLLGRPERITPGRRIHHRQVLEPDARGRQRWSIGSMRRREPDDAFARGAEGGQRRQHAAQLSHAFVCGEDFGERPDRPAASRQFTVERFESGRYRARGRSGGSAATPDQLPAKDFLEGRHGNCIFIQYRGGGQEGYSAQRFTALRMRSSGKPSFASTGARSNISR